MAVNLRVLVVRPWAEPMDDVLAVLARVGIEPAWELVDTRPGLLAALDRHEWDVVLYAPDARTEIPIELVYTHAPAAAVVMLTSTEDMTAELERLLAARGELGE